MIMIHIEDFFYSTLLLDVDQVSATEPLLAHVLWVVGVSPVHISGQSTRWEHWGKV